MSDPVSARHARVNLWMCVALHAVNHGLMAFLVPVFPMMQAEFGFRSLAKMGTLYFTYLFCYGLCNLPFGLLARRVRSKSIMTFGLALNAAAIAACFWTRDMKALVLLMGLAGIGGGSFHPVAIAFLTRLFPQAKGKALGLMGLGSSLGYAVAPFAGGFVAEAWGWQTLCLLIGVGGLLFAGVFWVLVHEPRNSVRSPDAEAGAPELCAGESGPWLTRGVFMLVALIFLLAAVRDTITAGGPYLTSFFAERIHHFSTRQLGILAALFFLPGAIVQPVMGWASDRFTRERVVTASLAGSVVVLAFMAKFSPLGLWWAVPGLGALLCASVPAVDALVADIVPERSRSTAYGILFTVGIGTGALSPLVLGMIVDMSQGTRRGYASAYTACAVWCFAGVVLAVIIRQIRRRRASRDG